MIEKTGPTIYKGESIYNTGAGGGSGSRIFDRVEIDGYKYPFVKIGNKYWTVENLRTKNGITETTTQISSTTPYVYTKNVYTMGYCYNFPACEYVKNNINLNGFRIPLEQDFIDLKNILVEQTCRKLKSITTWLNASGTDESFFNALATGYFLSGSWYNPGSTVDFWTSERVDANNAKNLWLGATQQEMIIESNLVHAGFCIRLCKDV
jgi:uncharacterized protein (TIGR02145 family)